MVVLFDLDQTLIDSGAAESLRQGRRWPQVYSLVPQMRPFDGIGELLAELRAKGIPICVVTASPATYCEKVMKHWGWVFDAAVCYHDTARHKPHPDPILEGTSRLGARPSQAVAVGDSPIDTVAAQAARVFAAGALWGSLDPEALLASKPDASFTTVAALRDFLRVRLVARQI